MSRLSRIQFEPFYRTGEHDLAKDFYIRALSSATGYDRSSGYFTGGALVVLAQGLQRFLLSDGRMRLVVSPRLDPHTVAAIQSGLEQQQRSRIAVDAVLRVFEEAAHTDLDATQLVAALVASDRLDIRIAVPMSAGERGEGIYHEKLGLFVGEGVDEVAFIGSPNETAGALLRNYESISVFRRNQGESDRVDSIRHRFEALWNDESPGVRTIAFPSAVRERLLQFVPADVIAFSQRLEAPGIELRRYQSEAIDAWIANGRRGIFAMATGTGKTLTALEAVSTLLDDGKIVIVAVPGVDLLNQWTAGIHRHVRGAMVTSCSSQHPRWERRVVRSLLQLHRPRSDRRPQFIVATAATASGQRFQHLIATASPEEIVLIGDEVHRLGSPKWQRVMSIPAGGGRLGLSATPNRQWDPVGTREIDKYFDGVVYEYSLKEALDEGWLSPYEYLIYPVGLDLDEQSAYRDITRTIGALLAELSSRYGIPIGDITSLLARARMDGDERLELTLYERADILKGARDKDRVVALVAQQDEIRTCLVYCNEESQVQESLKTLHSYGRTAIGFTSSRLETADRSLILRDFATGIYDFIVAIRCLDEGIDIPDTEHAVILASSRTEREWIQRRGRVLRLAPGKDRAVIHDCIVIPSRIDQDGYLLDPIETSEIAILTAELKRAREFASLATNMTSATAQIEELRSLVEAATPRSSPESGSRL